MYVCIWLCVFWKTLIVLFCAMFTNTLSELMKMFVFFAHFSIELWLFSCESPYASCMYIFLLIPNDSYHMSIRWEWLTMPMPMTMKIFCRTEFPICWRNQLLSTLTEAYSIFSSLQWLRHLLITWLVTVLVLSMLCNTSFIVTLNYQTIMIWNAYSMH